jgi:NAD(P)-dependent dehydrogenase (short-subunit alcohol dehydrogenase family)
MIASRKGVDARDEREHDEFRLRRAPARMSEFASVAGRSIIVTGASRGLGRAMALGLLEAGARVALVSTGPGGPLDQTLALAEKAAPPTHWTPVFGDLRDPAQCARIAAEARAAFGAVEMLVNNAAVPMSGDGPSFWDIEPDDWIRMTRTNCDTIFFMSRAVAPAMRAAGFGKIVNISSSDRSLVRPRFTPYGPSKAFVEACSRAWAEELRGSGVTMNVLCPGGVVDTAADVTGQNATGKKFLPAAVMVPPLLWLASDESNSVTGQRFLANLWDEKLPLESRIAAARQCGAELPRIM